MAKLAALNRSDGQATTLPTRSLDISDLGLAKIFENDSDDSSSVHSRSETKEFDHFRVEQTQVDQQLLQKRESPLYDPPSLLDPETDAAEAEAVAALNSAISKRPTAFVHVDPSMPVSNKALRGATKGKLPASKKFSYNENDLAKKARENVEDVYDIPESPKQTKSKKRRVAEESNADSSTKRAKLAPKSPPVSPRAARQNARAKFGERGHSEEKVQQVAVVVPEKSGRTRKVVQKNDSDGEQEPPSPPRPRGRSRNDPQPAQEPVSPPKSRGRPRKSDVTEQETEERNEPPASRKIRSRNIPVSKPSSKKSTGISNSQETAKRSKNDKPRPEQNKAAAGPSKSPRKSNRIAQQEAEESERSEANGSAARADTQRRQTRNARNSSNEDADDLAHGEERVVVVAEDSVSAVARSTASQSQKSNTSARRTVETTNAQRSVPPESSDAPDHQPANHEDSGADEIQASESEDGFSETEGVNIDEEIEDDFSGLQRQWTKVFDAVKRIGVKVVDGKEVYHRPHYKTTTAKTFVKICKQIDKQFAGDNEEEGEEGEETASFEDLQKLHHGILRTPKPTGDLVHDIYAKVIPVLIDLLEGAYYDYNSQAEDRRESTLPRDHTNVLLQIINMILDLNQTAFSWRILPTTDAPILKPIRFGAIPPLREIRKTLLAEIRNADKLREAASRRRKMIEELQDRAELEEQKLEAARLRQEHWKFWSRLDQFRQQAERNTHRRAFVALQYLPENTDLDVDSRGRSFERVAMFSQRTRRTLPQKIQLEDGNWTEEEQEALLESLEYYTDPDPLRMYKAIFENCCDSSGPLRKFNCQEIYNMAAYMKSLLLQEEAVDMQEPREWVKQIPNQY